MFSYSNSALVDAEVRYRREQLARDWSPRPAAPLDAMLTARGRLAFQPVRTLRATARRHRHA
jgi:hypothetical protein